MEQSIQTEYSGLTDVGAVRAANEDNLGHAKTSWGQVYVVCDGMGGHKGGATASSIAVSSILEFLAGDSGTDPAAALGRSIEFANEQVYATALSQPELKGMGTTVVALIIKESSIWIAHVGDSRAYLFVEGKLHRLSRDHSFVQGLVDQGVITDEQSESHPRKNELTRALGVRPEVEVEVIPDPIYAKKGDLFLLCSDGLYGMTTDSGIHSILSGAGNLDAKSSRLIQAANDAGGHDNITVQLISVTASPHQAARFKPVVPRADLSRTIPGTPAAEPGPGPAKTPPPFLKRFMVPIFFLCVLAVFVVFITWPSDTPDSKLDGLDTNNTLNTAQDSVPDSVAAKSTTDSLAKDTTDKKVVVPPTNSNPPANKPKDKLPSETPSEPGKVPK